MARYTGKSKTSSGNTGSPIKDGKVQAAHSTNYRSANKTGATWAPGKDMGHPQYSNISRHQATAKSRGPYKGPSFRSLSNSYKSMQKTDRSAVSKPVARPTAAATVHGQASKTGATGLSVLKARMRKIGR